MLVAAKAGAEEGLWLRAEHQTAGRGRIGRAWVSPVGNLHASTLVRLRPTDPAAATLALVAGVAVEETVGLFDDGHSSSLHFPRHPGPVSGSSMGSSERLDSEGRRPEQPWTPEQVRGDGGRSLKWPNDLLLGGAKLAGILLERAEGAVIIGIGVNLAHHPDLPDRPSTSLAAHGIEVAPGTFLETLAQTFARWLYRWRSEGLAPVRARWLERAHSIGTAITARLPDGTTVDGLFDGLDPDGALILGPAPTPAPLAGGERRVIHAGDVFLL